MVNKKAKKTVKKTEKKASVNPGSSPVKTMSRPNRTDRKKAPSEKKTPSGEKQTRAKKVTKKPSVETLNKETTEKKEKIKTAVQKDTLKKNANTGVFKGKDVLKIGKADESEMKTVANVIEKLSLKPEPVDQNDVPMVKLKNFFKTCLKKIWKSA